MTRAEEMAEAVVVSIRTNYPVGYKGMERLIAKALQEAMDKAYQDGYDEAVRDQK